MHTRFTLITAALLSAVAGTAAAQPDPHHPPAIEAGAGAGLLAQVQQPMQMPGNQPAGPMGTAPVEPNQTATAAPGAMSMEDLIRTCMNMMGMMQMNMMQMNLMQMGTMQMNMMQMMPMMMNMMQMTMGMDPAATMGFGAQGFGTAMTPATRDYMGAMTRMQGDMMDAMQVEDPDIAFVLGMIAHHEAAIAMSRTLLEFGQDERTRQWAEAIIAAQQREIDEMRAWLTERGR